MAAKKTAKKAAAKAAKATATEAVPEEPKVKLSALWEAARPAEELEGHHRLKTLLQGRSGSGKTTTAARIAQGDRVLFVPTELQAMATVKAINPKARIFHNSDKRPGLRDARDLQQFRAMIRDPDLPKIVDAVVLDSLTDCQRIIKDAYTKSQSSGRAQTDMDTWGSIIDLTARLAREVRDLEVHVIVTVIDEEAEVNGRLVHRPNVFGKKLPNDLAQYFNVVGFAHAAEMESGAVRFQTMFRAGGEKYMVKGLHGLDDIEPPEPMWWAHKVFRAELPEDVAARVAEWQGMENPEETVDPGAVPSTSNGKEEKPEEGDDPFASV